MPSSHLWEKCRRQSSVWLQCDLTGEVTDLFNGLVASCQQCCALDMSGHGQRWRVLCFGSPWWEGFMKPGSSSSQNMRIQMSLRESFAVSVYTSVLPERSYRGQKSSFVPLELFAEDGGFFKSSFFCNAIKTRGRAYRSV